MSSLGFALLGRAASVYSGTRVVLGVGVRSGSIDAVGADFLAAETLPALELTEAGVIAGSRAETLEPAAAAALVRHAGIRPPPEHQADRPRSGVSVAPSSCPPILPRSTMNVANATPLETTTQGAT